MAWRQNVVHVAAIATGTAVLALGIASPTPLNADGPTQSPENARPVVTVGAVNVSAALANASGTGATVPAGEANLTFRMTVSNPTQETQTVPLRLVLSQSAPTSRMSRAITLPTHSWEGQLELTLKPNETRTEEVAVSTVLQNGNTYQFHAFPAPSANATDAATKLVRINLNPVALVQFSAAAAAVVESE